MRARADYDADSTGASFIPLLLLSRYCFRWLLDSAAATPRST
ncbi:MAG: hypothetical protein ACREI4_09770 [Candidatus Rokuibacteriota bacterium]